MGSNKLLLPLGDSTVIDQLLQTFPYHLFQKVILVTGDEQIGKIAHTYDVTISYNHNPASGKSGSIHCGLAESTARDGVMFTVADQPFLTQDIFRTILEYFRQNNQTIVYPEVNGVPRNPVIFPAVFLNDLEELRGDSGGRTLFDQYPDKTLAVPFDSADDFMDIDTPQTYQDVVSRWKTIRS